MSQRGNVNSFGKKLAYRSIHESQKNIIFQSYITFDVMMTGYVKDIQFDLETYTGRRKHGKGAKKSKDVYLKLMGIIPTHHHHYHHFNERGDKREVKMRETKSEKMLNGIK